MSEHKLTTEELIFALETEASESNPYPAAAIMKQAAERLREFGEYIKMIEAEADGSRKIIEEQEIQIRNAEEDKVLLDALLNPAYHKPDTGWPYRDTRGTYEPPTISCFRHSLDDGAPIQIAAPKTRKELRDAIESAHRKGLPRCGTLLPRLG